MRQQIESKSISCTNGCISPIGWPLVFHRIFWQTKEPRKYIPHMCVVTESSVTHSALHPMFGGGRTGRGGAETRWTASRSSNFTGGKAMPVTEMEMEMGMTDANEIKTKINRISAKIGGGSEYHWPKVQLPCGCNDPLWSDRKWCASNPGAATRPYPEQLNLYKCIWKMGVNTPIVS